MKLDAVRGRHILLGEEFTPATVTMHDGRIQQFLPFEERVDGLCLDVADTAYVVPGVVDTHVHINEPGRTEWEGFATATAAAGFGGVTTLIDMPLNAIPPTTTVAHLRMKQRAAAEQLMVDVGFWGGAVPDNLADLESLWEQGVFGFKCFLADSGVPEFPPLEPTRFLAALREIARFDGLMIVHAEDAGVLAAHAPAGGSRAYSDFVASRPEQAELSAIRQVLDGARETGARVHILHLSSARALELIEEAKSEGLRVTVETCPHYLVFDAETIPDAAPQFKCCPPIRDRGNREELWAGLRSGIIDHVVSDHSPTTPQMKLRGDGDYQQAWGGVSGLQVGFAAIAHEARRRDIPLSHVSTWMSRNTADLVGLGQKGRIAIGADADLAVYDTAIPFDIRADQLAHRNAISAFDGLSLGGRVTHTVVRGEVVDTERPNHRWGNQLRRNT
ncbi:allantoinase AllB [Rhodococcus sp. GA1]|uniref:allantoinase AllB n=1 Tax=Rhodococcus sp. GA1 TaxID=2942275 RepID=UPI0020CED49A|nr:allantoinase AllB [Rhodococcus sp. GA1]